MNIQRILVAAWIIASSSAIVASAQAVDEPATETPSPKQKPAWMQYCELSLREYTLSSKTNPNASFELTRQPVFVHVDEVDLNGERGLLYVWTNKQGRSIAAITSVLMTWSNGNRWNELQEYHSLCDEPLRLVRQGATTWTPSGPGLAWKEVPKAAPPASTSNTRQLQAKAIARRFKARGESRSGKHWNFILKPRPVHSYDYTDAEGKLVAGCLFIFCRSTDPEVLLKLEVRTNEQGEASWHYGLGNFTNMISSVAFDGTDVWIDNPAAAPTRPHGSHIANKNFDFEARLKTMIAERDAKPK